MASKVSQSDHIKHKRWRARVKLDYVEYFLGCFDTKEEAKAKEKQFKESYRKIKQ